MQSETQLIGRIDPDGGQADHWRKIFGGELVPLKEYGEPFAVVDMNRLDPEARARFIKDWAERFSLTVADVEAGLQTKDGLYGDLLIRCADLVLEPEASVV